MVYLTFKDLEDWQARALLKLVDMMKTADERNEKVIKENGDVINLGKIPKHHLPLQMIGEKSWF